MTFSRSITFSEPQFPLLLNEDLLFKLYWRRNNNINAKPIAQGLTQPTSPHWSLSALYGNPFCGLIQPGLVPYTCWACILSISLAHMTVAVERQRKMLVFISCGHYQDVFLMPVFLLCGKASHNSALSGGKSVSRESFQNLSSTHCLWWSKLVQHCGKHIGSSSKTVKTELIPDIPLLLENKISRSKRHLWYHLQLLQHCSPCPRHRIKLNTHQFNE